MNEAMINEVEYLLRPVNSCQLSEGVTEELEREVKQLRRCVAVLLLHLSNNSVEAIKETFEESFR